MIFMTKNFYYTIIYFVILCNLIDSIGGLQKYKKKKYKKYNLKNITANV